VVRVVVSEAFVTVAIGLAFGVPAALAAGRAARGILGDVLFQLSPTDPVMVSSAVIAILVIATLAAYVPVRRASRIDPVVAIKAT
jgi:ABC-type antimicrobial peptide transport system permease subunit